MKSLIGTLLIAILISAPSNAQPASQRNGTKIAMATGVGTVQEQWQNKREFERRRRPVELNIAILSPLTLKVGDKIEMLLFDTETYTAKVNRSVTDVNGTFSIIARIEGTQHGYFSLSTKNRRSLGVIELPDQRRKFFIAYDRFSGVNHLTEVDPLSLDSLQCATPLIH